MALSVVCIRMFQLLLLVLLLLPVGLSSQSREQFKATDHEITIFVIPSLSPIDWSSPSTLYKSIKKCFIKSIVYKNQYVIGHTIVRITSPLLSSPYYVAMSGLVPSEKAELIFKKKVGLGALGATIRGHLEPEHHIHKGIEMYAKRNQVAYVKFLINEASVKRIMDFVQQYQRRTEHYAACDFYNGALWPRYEHEGSGCSAFGMSLLDLVNILPSVSEQWKISVKIPMELIGGELNNHREIKVGTIRRTNQWYIGSGVKDVDYVDYMIYDPSLIFNWISNSRKLDGTSDFKPEFENGLPGLVVDRQSVQVDQQAPLFLQRSDSNLFVRQYFRRLRAMAID